MLSNWKNKEKPALMKEGWPKINNKPIDYILFIDETGDRGLPKNNKKLKQLQNSPSFMYYPVFGLVGVLIDKDTYASIEKTFYEAKRKFWPPDGTIQDKQGNIQSVCFHSTDMVKKRGPFSSLTEEQREELDNIIWENVMRKEEFKIACAIIDKRYPDQIKKIACDEIHQSDIYLLATTFLLERTLNNTPKDKSLGFIFESRGKKEDNKLFKHIKKILLEIPICPNYKNQIYIKPNDNNRVEAVAWHPKYDHSKQKTITGFEMSDMLARAITSIYLGRNKKSYFYNILKDKFLKNSPKVFPSRKVQKIIKERGETIFDKDNCDSWT